MVKAPVVMIGYIRKDTLCESLYRLSQCLDVEGRELLLFLDAPATRAHEEASDKMLSVANEMRKKYLPRLQVIRREHNYGIPQNHIAAINEGLSKCDRIVFFEDDVCVSKTFLHYMDCALEMYKDNPRIFCVNGMFPCYMRSVADDVFLTPRLCPWGVGLWRDRWELVDHGLGNFEDETQLGLPFRSRLDHWGVYGMCEAIHRGKLKTWDVQCSYYMIKNGLYALTPRKSLAKNNGYGIGTNVRANPYLAQLKYYNFVPKLDEDIKVVPEVLEKFSRRPYRQIERVGYWFLKLACRYCDRHMSPIDM